MKIIEILYLIFNINKKIITYLRIMNNYILMIIILLYNLLYCNILLLALSLPQVVPGI